METKMIVNELTQGYELTRELQAQLNMASVDLCKSLVQEILGCYEKVISIAKASALPNLCIESPSSFTECPGGENSEQPFKAERKEIVSKKRKAQPKWKNQVKLGSGPEAEGPLEDGYSWRKYGQKEILGAKHPRSFPVLQSTGEVGGKNFTLQNLFILRTSLIAIIKIDGNQVTSGLSRTFNVPERIIVLLNCSKPNKLHPDLASYLTTLCCLKSCRGYYRCTYRSSQHCLAMKQVQRSDENPLIFEVTYRGTHTCQRKSAPPTTPTPSFPKLSHQDLLLSFQTNLKVETKNLPPPSSFSFPSTPIHNSMDNCLVTNFSSAFISPTTSDSNYLSADLSEIVSVATSTTNSPMLDMDFMLDTVELGQDFPFDAYSFWP